MTSKEHQPNQQTLKQVLKALNSRLGAKEPTDSNYREKKHRSAVEEDQRRKMREMKLCKIQFTYIRKMTNQFGGMMCGTCDVHESSGNVLYSKEVRHWDRSTSQREELPGRPGRVPSLGFCPVFH
ncbi:hypothetical protein RUM44_006652 [Polyplax serrata]|uniref:Uncharacterized protein n=1 Tax=Polyplax serrata TaxID=468196 RepID=A0ABR1AIP6_POLSC